MYCGGEFYHRGRGTVMCIAVVSSITVVEVLLCVLRWSVLSPW